MPRFLALAAVLAAGLPLWWAGRDDIERPPEEEITGEVRDDDGPIPGATVRVKGRPESIVTDAEGRFRLTVPRGARRVTASKDGYLIAGASTVDRPLVLLLQRLPATDCERYTWVDPTPDPSTPTNCGNCHFATYREWSLSGHARSADNRRLLGLYEGTDWHGLPDVGWSLRKDHPDGIGVCASCHAPTQTPGAFGVTDLHDAAKSPAGLRGVHCDFCHKVRGSGGGEFGLTHGKYQLSLLRPEPGKQLFFGPLDDVDRGEDVFSPFQRDSRLCAACHDGIVFGVPVYTTYSEWLSSPAGRTGTSCQSCHMAPTGRMSNIAPRKGGIRRDPATLGSHALFTGSQIEMLRRCLQLDAAMRRTREGIDLDVTLLAHGVGHHVPTGFIDRQVMLSVAAFSGDQALPLLGGPRLPNVLGPEARKPGRLYAKWLTDGKGDGPAPFWRGDPATLRDTRLRPGDPDHQIYRFPAGTDRVVVRLVHRRFWKVVADEKNWPRDEELILERSLVLPRREIEPAP
jgi:hypothetical protein